MSESEIIKIECDAIRKFCRGDRQLALQIIQICAADMRLYFQANYPKKVTTDELCDIIKDVIHRSKGARHDH